MYLRFSWFPRFELRSGQWLDLVSRDRPVRLCNPGAAERSVAWRLTYYTIAGYIHFTTDHWIGEGIFFTPFEASATPVFGRPPILKESGMNVRILSVVLACFPAAAEAASFNCAHAFLPAEETICGDANLGQLDEKTAGLYFLIVGSSPPQPTLDEVKGPLRVVAQGPARIVRVPPLEEPQQAIAPARLPATA